MGVGEAPKATKEAFLRGTLGMRILNPFRSSGRLIGLLAVRCLCPKYPMPRVRTPLLVRSLFLRSSPIGPFNTVSMLSKLLNMYSPEISPHAGTIRPSNPGPAVPISTVPREIFSANVLPFPKAPPEYTFTSSCPLLSLAT